ncbi:hypothetical protein V6N11_068829 [Hibiscus sabdariffa]|uniref:Uncharacterized protein n=1 Tax=Hibiscus sabdariffa TaxID=183260 RepID=A0ABR2PBC8_9ROSI
MKRVGKPAGMQELQPTPHSNSGLEQPIESGKSVQYLSSGNHLVGLIPQGNQFNTFPNDSYIGNTGLCGFPVSKGCGHSEPPPATFEEQEAGSAFGLDWIGNP